MDKDFWSKVAGNINLKDIAQGGDQNPSVTLESFRNTVSNAIGREAIRHGIEQDDLSILDKFYPGHATLNDPDNIHAVELLMDRMVEEGYLSDDPQKVEASKTHHKGARNFLFDFSTPMFWDHAMQDGEPVRKPVFVNGHDLVKLHHIYHSLSHLLEKHGNAMSEEKRASLSRRQHLIGQVSSSVQNARSLGIKHDVDELNHSEAFIDQAFEADPDCAKEYPFIHQASLISLGKDSLDGILHSAIEGNFTTDSLPALRTSLDILARFDAIPTNRLLSNIDEMREGQSNTAKSHLRVIRLAVVDWHNNRSERLGTEADSAPSEP